MKAKPEQLRSLIKQRPAHIRLWLLIGPDEAGNAKLAQQLGQSFGEGAEKLQLSGRALRDDPALLVTEANSMSLFGDRRWILVETSKEESLAAVRMLLAADEIVNPVVMLASSVSEKSRIAKEVIASKTGYCCHSWLPKPHEMAAMVAELARQQGLVLSHDHAMQIGEYSGSDQRLAEAEIEKLALYLDASPNAPKKVEADHIAALSAAAGDDNMMPVINISLGGNLKLLPSELERIEQMGLSAIGLMILLQRRVMQLADIASKSGGRGNIRDIVEQEARARRIFFGEKNEISRQAQLWSAPLLARLSERLILLQQQMMRTGNDAGLLLRQELLVIAQMAARNR